MVLTYTGDTQTIDGNRCEVFEDTLIQSKMNGAFSATDEI